nr:hypothetical protein PPFHPHBJ_00011 [Cydia pomonella granulovirus]WOZ44787.1 hypothetical protein HDNAPKKO_00013 [Cydia pomonella granulovirus]WOZ44923.1 hypothetical protein GGGKFHNK_00011 [Cydia pomonella granulovirus]WOZ45059.1 hypothetical protein BGFFOGFG_00011 [Cydia pomonella granulovirus]WOZ45580.1 hypothetical protein AAGMHLIN_00009 [Cydia pomonella granulovirus]
MDMVKKIEGLLRHAHTTHPLRHLPQADCTTHRRFYYITNDDLADWVYNDDNYYDPNVHNTPALLQILAASALYNSRQRNIHPHYSDVMFERLAQGLLQRPGCLLIYRLTYRNFSTITIKWCVFFSSQTKIVDNCYSSRCTLRCCTHS